MLKDGDSSLDPPRILISDFGECEVLSDVHQQERTGATGTLEFMPPELLSRDSSGSFRQDHSQKADIWSLGVVLYFLCYSQVPYTQIADVELLKEEILGFKKVYFPYETPRVSQTLQELMRRLLQTAPELRPTVQEIYSTYKDSMPAFPVTSSRSKTEDATRVPLGNRPIEALSLTTGQRLNITELSVANVAGLSSGNVFYLPLSSLQLEC